MPNMTRADRRGVRRSAGSVLTALGLTLEEERQYQQLLPLSGGPAADVAIVLGTTEEELGERLAPLLERGLVSLEGTRLVVLTLPALVARLIEEQALTAARARERLHDLSAAIPYLVASATRPGPGQMEELGGLDGELSAGGNALQLLTDLIENSQGDLLWWRPDAWLLPREAAISVVVGRAVASGRLSRAIYPLRALHEAPEVLQARARQGEQVRVIDEMPTRMLVIRGHPRDPPGAARVRRRAPAAGAAVGHRRRPHPAVRALLGPGHRAARPRHPSALASTSAAACCASSRRAPRTSRSPAPSASACAPCGAGSPT